MPCISLPQTAYGSGNRSFTGNIKVVAQWSFPLGHYWFGETAYRLDELLFKLLEAELLWLAA